MKAKAYDKITDRILELLEQGTCPWRRPWSRSRLRPQNGQTRHKYSGINLFLLEAMAYESPFFMTFKQVKAKGGNIKKGSTGLPVIYWSTFEREDSEAKDNVRHIPFLKYYTVFNASQIEGMEFPEEENAPTIDFEPIEAAQALAENWQDGPPVEHGSSRACYIPALDKIRLPSPERFNSAADYYQTRFHEMGHATGHDKRLNRDMSGNFGSESYGKEELIAEMTAAYLCAECGIDNQVIKNEAAYLSGWIKAIKGDNKLVISAAAQAQKAANLILGTEARKQSEAA